MSRKRIEEERLLQIINNPQAMTQDEALLWLAGERWHEKKGLLISEDHLLPESYDTHKAALGDTLAKHLGLGRDRNSGPNGVRMAMNAEVAEAYFAQRGTPLIIQGKTLER